MAQVTSRNRPKLTIIIPYTPSLLFSCPKTSSSSSQKTKSTAPTSLSSSTALLAPITSFPPPSTIFLSIPKFNPCLQCQILGLKCSFTTAAHMVQPRMRLHPSFPRPDEQHCVRCKRNDESPCIRQSDVGDGREVEYRADGMSEMELKRRLREMFEQRDGKVKWALPKAPKEHRECITPGRWLWKREEGEDAQSLGEVSESAPH